MRALLHNPRVAALACALVACVWLNQGPSAARYDAIAAAVQRGGHVGLAAWRPLAFAYRRAQGEEVYYAFANAVRGAPYDRDVLLRDRGEVPEAFRRLPEADGRWHAPYGDVPFEYPALLLPFVWIPAWVASSFEEFARLFGAAMGMLVVAGIILAMKVRGGSAEQRARTLWIGALLCLAQGGLLVQRLDAVPAALLAVALWAAVRGKAFGFGVAVGLAGASKVVPGVVFLPMALAAFPWRRPELAARAGGGLVAGLGLGLAPMFLLWPGSLGELLAYHAGRGLHVESTYGVLLGIAAVALGRPEVATRSFGSFNLDSPTAEALARAAAPLLAALVTALAVWVARRPGAVDEDERTTRIAAAGLGALLCAWLAGKVFSPQYMTWAIPFALAIAPPRRSGVALALLVAMASTQLYLRGFYDAVTAMRPIGVAVLAARLGVLLVLAVRVMGAVDYAAGRRMRATPNAA